MLISFQSKALPLIYLTISFGYWSSSHVIAKTKSNESQGLEATLLKALHSCLISTYRWEYWCLRFPTSVFNPCDVLCKLSPWLDCNDGVEAKFFNITNSHFIHTNPLKGTRVSTYIYIYMGMYKPLPCYHTNNCLFLSNIVCYISLSPTPSKVTLWLWSLQNNLQQYGAFKLWQIFIVSKLSYSFGRWNCCIPLCTLSRNNCFLNNLVVEVTSKTQISLVG